MWEKRRVGDTNIYHYIVNTRSVGTVMPTFFEDGSKKWECTFSDHLPFIRDSLKIGKKDIEFLWEQLNSNNLATIDTK